MDNIVKRTKPRLVLFDMFNLTIGLNAASNIVNRDAEQVGMYLGTLNMIRTISDKLVASKVFCCYDGPEAGARRRSMFKEYKNKKRVKTRYSTIKIYDDENNVSEYIQKGTFELQLSKIYEATKLLPITNLIIPGCEADDIIAYAALKYQDEYDVYIVSRDKDYLQLINENIKVYNWNKKKIYNLDTFKEEFGITPHNYIYMKILLGDVSDKIDGIKGVGKKTVKHLEEFFNSKQFKDCEDFLNELKKLELYQFDTRTRNAITNIFTKEMEEKFLLSFRLMKLNEDCLRIHHIDIFNTQIEQQKNKKLDRIKLMVLSQRDEFNRMHNGFNYNNWVLPFIVLNKK